MKKLSFLIAVGIFCLNCGSATNTNVTVKPANAPAANTAANKPATPANTAPANTAAAPASDTKSNPELDFTLVNKTGYDIKEVSVGPSGENTWTKEDEILKGRPLANGASLDVKFSPRATGADWDVMVAWADGSGTEEWLKLDLTQIEKVTLNYDKATDKTTAVVE